MSGWDQSGAWRRRRGGSVLSRVEPDDHDQLVFYGVESDGTMVNRGAAGTLVLSPEGGAFILGPGQFGELAVQTRNATWGALRSPNTTKGEAAAALTIEAWGFFTGTNADGADQAVIHKAYKQGSWSSPYVSAALHVFADGRILAVAGGGVITTTAVTLGAWRHFALTCDTDHGLRFWEAGGLITSDPDATTLDWGEHAHWSIGGICDNFGYYHSPNMVIGEIRVADVARPADYFARVWAGRRVP